MVALVLDDDKTNDDRNGKEIGKKWYVYINKQQLCTCITLFCTFFAVVAPLWWTQHKNCSFHFLSLDNVRYGPKENFAKICQIKWNWIRSVKFEIVQIDFEVTFSVCCHTKILLPWQHDVTTCPLYTPHLLWVYRHDNPRAMLGEHSKRL